MNIYDYIEKNKDYTFKEKNITEIDCAIFSFISYIVLNKKYDYKKRTIRDISINYLINTSKNIMALRDAYKLINILKDTIRYKDLIIYNYEYYNDSKIQFGALSILYDKNKVFVSFEGTDEYISGWKENLLLSTDFPTETQKLSIKYLNKHFTLSNKKLIVGGHSKGGNLALVSSMYANLIVRRKIKTIYSFDGPGLLEEYIDNRRINNIKDKYIHIIPNNSIVGVLLKNFNNNAVEVNSNLFSHNLVYWNISNNKFKRDKISNFSKKIEKEFDRLIKITPNTELENLINSLDKIVREVGINSLLDLFNKKTIILNLVLESKKLNEESKKILINIIEIFIKSYIDSKKENIIDKFKKI